MERPIAFEVAGETVRGMLHLPRRRPAPGVVLLHGFTAGRCESAFLFVRLARALCEAGVAALRFDFRGSGDSDGELRDLTIEGEVADARAALARLRGERAIEPRRLGLLGVSLGSTVAALVAGRERSLRALCLWATLARPERRFPAPTSPEELAELRAHGFVDHRHGGFPLGPAFFASAARVDPVGAMRRYRGALLCVHGERDYLPLEEPQLVLDATAAAPKALVVVPDGEHVFGSWRARTEALEVTRDFFVRTLLGPEAATSLAAGARSRSSGTPRGRSGRTRPTAARR
jgi:hypothetical protein